MPLSLYWWLLVPLAWVIGILLGSLIAILLLQRRIRNQRSWLDQMEDERDAARERLTQALAESEARSLVLQAAQNELVVVHASLDRIQKELEDKTRVLDKTLATKASMESFIKTSDQDLVTTQAELAKANKSLDLLRQTQAAFESSLRERDAELVSVKTQLAELGRNNGSGRLAEPYEEHDEGLVYQPETPGEFLQENVEAELPPVEEESAPSKETDPLAAQDAESASATGEGASVFETYEEQPLPVEQVVEPEEEIREGIPVPHETAVAVAEAPTLLLLPPPPAQLSVDETPSEVLRTFAAACPQHLSDVKGIGPIFEQRLYDAGIGSYWQLSQASKEELARILCLTPLQLERFDFSGLRDDALRLAQETKTLGRVWNCQPPDDFELITGIGPTFEKRLYNAGICTYEALAALTAEMLEQICRAPAFRRPNYESWIERARELAAERSEMQVQEG